MSDAASVATKNTQLTAATGVSRASKSGTKKATRMSKADWRVVVRDGFAALFDMVGDWAYLYAIYHRDYDGDGEADQYLLNVKFNYEMIVRVVLAFCILSTILSVWTIFSSLGRWCGMNSLCCNCTVPRLALAAVVFEDFPQFILTVYIDYTFAGGLTPAGMLNICSSLTALINRATTRYDQIEAEPEPDNDEESKLGTVYEAMA